MLISIQNIQSNCPYPLPMGLCESFTTERVHLRLSVQSVWKRFSLVSQNQLQLLFASLISLNNSICRVEIQSGRVNTTHSTTSVWRAPMCKERSRWSPRIV